MWQILGGKRRKRPKCSRLRRFFNCCGRFRSESAVADFRLQKKKTIMIHDGNGQICSSSSFLAVLRHRPTTRWPRNRFSAHSTRQCGTVVHHALQDWGLICFTIAEYWAKSIMQSLLGIIGDLAFFLINSARCFRNLIKA